MATQGLYADRAAESRWDVHVYAVFEPLGRSVVRVLAGTISGADVLRVELRRCDGLSGESGRCLYGESGSASLSRAGVSMVFQP